MLVYAGREDWIWNELLDHIGAGISAMYLPQGSRLAAIEYSTGARIKIPWEPAADFKREQLGTKSDYRGHVGSDLVQGVMMGLAELAKQPSAQRHLILVGDGADTNNDAARVMLGELAAQAKRLDVRIHVVDVHGRDSPSANVRAILDPGPTMSGGSGAGQAEEVETIITSIGAGN